MDENLIQTETEEQYSANQIEKPEESDNSLSETQEKMSNSANPNSEVGESVATDPTERLILGKFKSVDDLSKAYQELQSSHGRHADELGQLRKEANEYKHLVETCNMFQGMVDNIKASYAKDMEKYNTPEYFQDPTFREIYNEAVYALGDNLDTDKFVNLLETYVSARIFASDRRKAANKETQRVLDSMTYSKNPKSSFAPPKKRFDEMTDKEIDELLERRI